jgi:hypothetical protein
MKTVSLILDSVEKAIIYFRNRIAIKKKLPSVRPEIG